MGWDKLRYEDEVPLCVFTDHQHRDTTEYLKDVKKQTLKADSRIVFGAFPADCISEECDAVPTLECWVDPGEQPTTLVVHTRFRYEHKQGTACSTNCSPIMAGCETPVLKAGNYTVKYGARSFPLRIPSVVRKPCFELSP